jgi:bifunctional non-homologous end joining protein LigD
MILKRMVYWELETSHHWQFCSYNGPGSRMAPLKDYQRKRQFHSTPEPRGKTHAGTGNRFVVQEHHARRLHYDFRLELNGVLKSWAVPKGPSLNPGDKRLAIQTEDHPLEYRKFEGVIPAGNYGAGQVTIWDEGTFKMEWPLKAEEQIQRGELKFQLHGRKLRGSFVLVKLRGKEIGKDTGKEWLLIKHADEWARPDWNIDENPSDEARSDSSPKKRLRKKLKLPDRARKASMPEMIQPALATLCDGPFSGSDWLFEIKWDGMRTLARIHNGRSRLWSRSNLEITGEYPEMSGLANHVDASEAWLDGEIVALDSEGRSDFQRLQLRFGVQNPSAQLLESTPVVFYVFDIVYFNGYDLHKVPLIERKELLRDVLRDNSKIRYSDHVVQEGEELYQLAVARRLEGLVAKQIASPYHEGRSSAWIKIKLDADSDAVIAGWTAPRGSREYFGALLLGLYEKGRLQFIGGVGTGFSRETQRLLWPKLQKLNIDECPFATRPSTREKAYWVKPELVARVKFSSWTQDRHLRAPRFLGLQEDRPPEDCTFEKEMKPAAVVSAAKKGVLKAASPKSKTATRLPGSREPELTSDRKIEEELTRGTSQSVFVEIDGRRLHLTNLNKIYFPDDGYTKRDLLAYYFRIAPLILPFLNDRPLVLRRYPNGIDGKAFFQKDAPIETPEWAKTATIRSEDKNKPIHYILANDRATLIYLTNLGCIDHNPWSSRYDNQDYPDYIFFDLDPTPQTPFSIVAKVGKLLLENLKKLGMTALPKTSGATGLHIFLPVEPRYTFEQARMFVEAVASMVDKEHPRLITFERSVSKRPNGMIYVDAHQNSRGQSLASVYSIRAFPHAPASVPLKTTELTATMDPSRWNLRSMDERLKKAGDLWAHFWNKRQRLESLLELEE